MLHLRYQVVVRCVAMERSVRVLFVIIILCVIAAIVTQNVIGRIDDAQKVKAAAQITIIARAVTRYQHREGLYPDSLAELVLSGDLDQVVRDPWGNPYFYSTSRPDIVEQELAYYIWSLGQDNREGGQSIDQDLGNWTTRIADGI